MIGWLPRSVALAFATALLWGLSGPIAKLISRDGLSMISAVTYRCLLLGAIAQEAGALLSSTHSSLPYSTAFAAPSRNVPAKTSSPTGWVVTSSPVVSAKQALVSSLGV